jgi:hypothetical protein
MASKGSAEAMNQYENVLKEILSFGCVLEDP